MNSPAAHYRGYSDLTRSQFEGIDFRIQVRSKAASPVAVIAPHGGGIEEYTSEIARAIAGEDFNLYLFEGVRQAGNFASLHLTSHRFDEPRCVNLLSNCDHVVAVHGCAGDRQEVLVGGLDEALKSAIAGSLSAIGVATLLTGHRFPAIDPNNICNRGRRGAGVQIEMTTALRFQGPHEPICAAVRSVLAALPQTS